MPRESYDQQKIIAALRARGAYVTNIHGTGYSRAGTPDLICCYRGLYLAFECKNRRIKQAAKGLSLEQKCHEIMIHHAGGRYYSVSSVEQVTFILDEIDAITLG